MAYFQSATWLSLPGVVEEVGVRGGRSSSAYGRYTFVVNGQVFHSESVYLGIFEGSSASRYSDYLHRRYPRGSTLLMLAWFALPILLALGVRSGNLGYGLPLGMCLLFILWVSGWKDDSGYSTKCMAPAPMGQTAPCR